MGSITASSHYSDGTRRSTFFLTPFFQLDEELAGCRITRASLRLVVRAIEDTVDGICYVEDHTPLVGFATSQLDYHVEDRRAGTLSLQLVQPTAASVELSGCGRVTELIS